jgi:Putative restriction endonuclease
LLEKRRFYRRYGVEEYIVYDPDEIALDIYVRDGKSFGPVHEVNGGVSPRLGIKFDTTCDDLVITAPNGRRFLSFEELTTENERLRAKLRAAGTDPDAA